MTRKKIVLAAMLLLIGSGILFYPLVSNIINRSHGSYAIAQIQQQVKNTDAAQIQNQRMLAQRYNRALVEGEKPEGYTEILNISDGMMGYIQIPKIKVNLPIYHGVEEEVLTKGVGHMEQTSFPVGGEGNHAVLTGHTGLPSAKLFTDLADMKEGDHFYIHILNESIDYEVDQIKVVLPSEGQDLMPVPGKDFCTLVTCTPYGVNSHRLLVRGERITDTMVEMEETRSTGTSRNTILWLSGSIFVLAVLAVAVLAYVRKRE